MKHDITPDQTDLLASALLQSDDRIDLIDVEGTVIRSNRDTVLGAPWLDAWHESCRKKAAEAFDAARNGRCVKVECYRRESGDDAWWVVRLSPVRKPCGAVTAILSIGSENTNERERLLEQQKVSEAAVKDAEKSDLVAREMRHRLKNLISIIDSLARMTSRETSGVDFIQIFSRRLANLSVAQDLLTAESNKQVSLGLALDTILGGSGQAHQIKLDEIPDVSVSDTSLTTIVLLIGELLTNSLKYGALKNDDGKVALNSKLAGNSLMFSWKEDCGEPVLPGPEGSGYALMRRITAGSDVPFSVDWTGMGITIQFGVILPQRLNITA